MKRTIAVVAILALTFGFAGDVKPVRAQSPGGTAGGHGCAECRARLRLCFGVGTAVEQAVCIALYFVCANQVLTDTGKSCRVPKELIDVSVE